MSKALTEKMLRWQADRCETAKGKRCECRCGGAFHGIYHTNEWIADEVKKEREAPERKKAVTRLMDRVMKQIDARQTDWVGYDEFEQYS